MSRAIIVGCIGLMLLNCGAVLVNAPRGQTVTLLADEPTIVKVTMRNWYVLWGLIPLTNNSTGEMIGRANLTGVRVRKYFGPLDFVLNIILSPLTLHTNTVVIEGNVGR